jgi:hypothetical protein
VLINRNYYLISQALALITPHYTMALVLIFIFCLCITLWPLPLAFVAHLNLLPLLPLVSQPLPQMGAAGTLLGEQRLIGKKQGLND